MTLTTDQYIGRVLGQMPAAMPERAGIEMELRSLIAERIEHGQPLSDVLRQLGDPAALADSYLAEIPLVAATFLRRGAAKCLDVLTLAVMMAPVGWAIGRAIDIPFLGVVVSLVLAGLFLGLYTAVAEWRYGKTIGKHLMDLRVVRESGARISFGQALVRQLPQWLEAFWIDVLFALFTERKQRAFELLSKTRVVLALPAAQPAAHGASSICV